jgi:hypothetical protein
VELLVRLPQPIEDQQRVHTLVLNAVVELEFLADSGDFRREADQLTTHGLILGEYAAARAYEHQHAGE